MTNAICSICGNPKYNNNWKEIKYKDTYELFCDNTECQKHYLIKFFNCFLEESKQEESNGI